MKINRLVLSGEYFEARLSNYAGRPALTAGCCGRMIGKVYSKADAEALIDSMKRELDDLRYSILYDDAFSLLPKEVPVIPDGKEEF